MSAPRSQPDAPATRRRNRHAQHRRWPYKWITQTELGDLIAQGLTPADIARLKNVNDSMVHRASKVLTDDVIESRRIIGVMAVEVRRGRDVAQALVPPRIEGEVDLVDTMLSALADIKMSRAWFDTAAGQDLPKLRWITHVVQLAEAVMRWSGQFVDIRHKLLDLIAVDTWITELTEMLQDIQREHAEAFKAAGLDLRQVFLDRIRGKILGRSVERMTRDMTQEVIDVVESSPSGANGTVGESLP